VTGTTSADIEEIAEGVDDLQLSYLLNTNNQYYQNRIVNPDDQYRDGVGANQWPLVLAVRIAMRFVGPEQVGGQDVARNLTHTVAIRNQNL
jgi:hypothetical protein